VSATDRYVIDKPPRCIIDIIESKSTVRKVLFRLIYRVPDCHVFDYLNYHQMSVDILHFVRNAIARFQVQCNSVLQSNSSRMQLNFTKNAYYHYTEQPYRDRYRNERENYKLIVYSIKYSVF